MSFAAVNDPVPPPPHDILPKMEESEAKPKYRSYKSVRTASQTTGYAIDIVGRKKFLKLKRRFERAMIDSTTSYEDEQKLIRTAKRLRESNEYVYCYSQHSRR